MADETNTWPVKVHTSGGLYHWTIIDPETGRAARRSERGYADSWEASTAGHNVERELLAQVKRRERADAFHAAVRELMAAQ